MRRNATQSKRDHNRKAKWAHGSRPGFGQGWESYTSVRPVIPQAKSQHDRQYHTYIIKRKSLPSKNTRSYFRSVYDEGMKEASDLSDSLNDDVPDPSSPADMREVFYSFDASSGPRAGEHLFSAALNKAVERFEFKETEKLVREYEFIEERESADSEGYTADDDDYEMVDHATL
ncbi:hypothetical protein PRK78_004641 [Emydomyces testavorans]|uniref:Uncharacterized protein n=1 Tax=Emydomyces testavorans TaxID=2070801 RepID=A0AAF0IJS5_9EURO|nr:hypothetical protein PRK78_004641 [Emydomyces testavorans]